MTVEIIEKLKIEKSELDDKRKRLNDFLKTDKFMESEPLQRHALARQACVMREYSEILDERITLLLGWKENRPATESAGGCDIEKM